jgi:hypothetical protein
MTLGYRNDTTLYPTIDRNNGLGETKFVVAVGSSTTTNANALLITEGGISGGSGGTVPQVPRVILPTVPSFSASDDTAATAIGIPSGGLYQSNGGLRINTGSTVINQGMWTPQLIGLGSGINFNFVPTTGYPQGTYNIIGNTITCWFEIRGTATWASSTGSPFIEGLPYAIASSPSGGTVESIGGVFTYTEGTNSIPVSFTKSSSNRVGLTHQSNNLISTVSLGSVITSGALFRLKGYINYRLA